jgi:hypothetical protein
VSGRKEPGEAAKETLACCSQACMGFATLLAPVSSLDFLSKRKLTSEGTELLARRDVSRRWPGQSQ